MSSGNAMTAPTYEVKPPSAVLAEDVICQSFIQSSSTLAYACLLIRRGRHDLAAHVLHSLEQKPASRCKDMVFYLQAQIGIETGDFAAVKKRLAPRAHQHPNDMVALNLLASAVFLEWEDWNRRNPAAAARTIAEERTVTDAPEFPSEPESVPAYHTLSVPTVPSAHAAFSNLAPATPGLGSTGVAGSPPASPASSGVFPLDEALAAAMPAVPAPTPAAPAAPAPRAHAAFTPVYQPAAGAPAPEQPAFVPAGDNDFGIYQTLASDAQTQALSLWNLGTRKLKTACKKTGLEALVAALPEALPGGLAEPIRSLEGGEIHKVCFSFQGLTVTSLHAGPENLGLVTGNMAQSLLTMVRAENIFLKGTQGAANVARAGAAT